MKKGASWTYDTPSVAYVIERFMNVYQAVFPLFIWSFQEKSVILQ